MADRPQASPHFFRRDFNKLEIGQSVGRSIVVAPRGWPSFSFPWFRAGGNERRVNIRLLQMLMVHVGVKNEGIRERTDSRTPRRTVPTRSSSATARTITGSISALCSRTRMGAALTSSSRRCPSTARSSAARSPRMMAPNRPRSRATVRRRHAEVREGVGDDA